MKPLEAIEFGVIGDIKAKERPRKGCGGRFYTPRATVEAEKRIRAAAVAEYGRKVGHPGLEPTPIGNSGFEVTILIRHAMPRGWSTRKRILHANKFKATARADVDNVAKAILDALNGVFYKDDKQVCVLTVKRLWGDLRQEETSLRVAVSLIQSDA